MSQTHFVIAIAGFALSACGFRDSPAASESEGEGGSAGSGGGIGPPLEVCNDLRAPDPRGFVSCAPYPDQIGQVPTTLVVVGATNLCPDVGTFLGAAYPQSDRITWELRDDADRRFNVGFAIGPVSPSVLLDGDVVVVTQDSWLAPAPDVDQRGSRGFLAIEKSGQPAIFFAYAKLPTLGAIPDFAVEPGEFECGSAIGEQCGARRRMRVTANGESVDLAMGESAELAGLELRSGGLSDNRTCDPGTFHGPPIDFMLAGFRIPD